MQKKKSRFWLFIWSLVPGAGEMYLGFMKMGVSLMLGFALLIMVAAITNIGALALFPIVMYVYSFFHANNLGTLSDAEFYEMKDQYLFGMEGLDSMEKMRAGISTKYRKAAAIVLIVIGVIMLWNMAFDLLVDIFGNTLLLKQIRFFMNRMPRAVIAVAVIWIGIGLIRGKKVEYIEDEQDIQDTVKKQNVSGEQAESQQAVPVEQSVFDGRNDQ